MIQPLPHSSLPDMIPGLDARPSAFPRLDRAFDAVERALAQLGIEDPASLRTPRPIEEVLHDRALPEGTMLVLNPTEIRAAEIDIEDTVRDERLGGSVFLSLPDPEELGERARGLREIGSVARTFGFNASLRPMPAARLGKVTQVPLPLHLRSYRFLCADTPGFRVLLITRQLWGGGCIGLWTGNDLLIDEFRDVVAEVAHGAGHEVSDASPSVPPLEGIESAADVWKQAEELRAYRVVREAELREIARAAALRGVQLRREREAKRRAAAG